MNPKSGKAGTPVSPAASKKPDPADLADPGQMASIKAEQQKKGQGKYGSTPVKPHKPPQTEEEKEKKKSWIEIVLQDDEKGKPIAGEVVWVKLPDDSLYQGTLNEKGVVRIEHIEPGMCQVFFPNMEDDQWELKKT